MSMQLIEWEHGFKLGITLNRIIPPTCVPYTRDFFMPIIIDDNYERILFNEMIKTAPCLFDKAMEKAERHGWKYYSVDKYPGAVILLGSK
jgi:hypothetical protein